MKLWLSLCEIFNSSISIFKWQGAESCDENPTELIDSKLSAVLRLRDLAYWTFSARNFGDCPGGRYWFIA